MLKYQEGLRDEPELRSPNLSTSSLGPDTASAATTESAAPSLSSMSSSAPLSRTSSTSSSNLSMHPNAQAAHSQACGFELLNSLHRQLLEDTASIRNRRETTPGGSAIDSGASASRPSVSETAEQREARLKAEDVAKVNEELARYLAEPLTGTHVNPLAYWQVRRSGTYAILWKLTLLYLEQAERIPFAVPSSHGHLTHSSISCSKRAGLLLQQGD